MDDLTRLLGALVSIPSVNPMGRALVGPEFLETRLTGFLEDWFREREIPCRRQHVSPGRDNLLARFDSPGSTRTLIFDVHQDTVPTDGMTIPPFEPKVEQGRLYGRGSCDIKGSMAAMLTAIERLHRDKPTGAATVILACTVDEEFTHTGASTLATAEHGADLAIVAEPTKLNLVHSHKGALRWKIRTTGRACHSSTPQLGVNAIYRMGPVLEALEAYAARLAASTADPLLGPPSLSVGRIEGGQSVNIVPDWCEVEIDRRLIPGESPESALAAARIDLSERLGGLSGIDFGAPWVNMPPLVPKSGPWLDQLKEAVAEATGHTPELHGVPYGTDAGPLSATGLPCVVFGPGDIAQAHTRDEWIELDEVRLAAEAYFRIACSLGR